MQSTAKVIPIADARSDGYRRMPDVHDRVRGKGREIFVKRLREIADAIERGELDGARAQWLDTHGGDVKNGTIEADGTVISGMEILTRTAWTEDGSGQVKLVCTTVEEV
jgi:hypothetical protein